MMMSDRPSASRDLLERGDEGQVARGEGGDADHVDIVLDGLAGGLLGGREHGTDIDVEAEIGEGGGDDLLAPVVAVLTDLGDQDSRPAPFELGELVGESAGLGDICHAFSHFLFVDAADGADDRPVASVDLFQSVAHLADGRLGPGGLDAEGEEIAFAAFGGRGEGVEGGRDGGVVAFGAQRLEAGDLGLEDRRVVDLENIDLLLVVEGEAVEPDDGLTARVDPGLGAGGGLLDPHLGQTGRDRLGHPAEFLDLGDVRPGALGELDG